MALLRAQHLAFLAASAAETETLEAVASSHLRLSGVYWALSAATLLDPQAVASGLLGPPEALVAAVLACQCLALLGALDQVDADAVAAYVASLQQPDGSFVGDAHAGEVDTRFSYCALSACALLARLRALDVPAAARFVRRCANFDAGFGARPGCESHAGQVFTALGALAIAGDLAGVDAPRLGAWLAARQLSGGGLCGRPEKAPDVCYSWWVLSSLAILGRIHWISAPALAGFILGAQDGAKGGIADRPDDEADVFHTFFGVAGLALLGREGLPAVDPVYALPLELTARLGLRDADGRLTPP